MFSSKLRLMLGGGFILITSVCVLFTALGSFLHINSFVRSSTKVEGRVIRIIDGASPSIHYPVYGFRDADGGFHRVFTDVDNVHPANYNVDDKVPLLYQPAHPEDAQRATFWLLWKKPVLLGGLGIAGALLGSGILLVAKSQ